MDQHPSLPKDFKDFQTLYSMIKYKNLTGETIKGRYQITQLIGVGGMGDVYRAIDIHTKEIVAIKRLMPSSYSKSKQVLDKRFFQEVACLEAIQNPYVVKIYDSFELDSYCFLVMEYVEGETIEKIVRQTYNTEKRLTTLEHVSIMTKITRGLEAIHATGVIHRDIKPANIMVNRLKDVVKILDFGLAYPLDGENDLSTLSGTIAYMSPEQITNNHPSISSDLFSLGCTFYYMLTGNPPFTGEGIQCMIQICEINPPPPYEINAEVPKALSELVMKVIEKKPENRFLNALELAISLEELRQRFCNHLSEVLMPKKHPLAMSITQKLSPSELYFLKQIADLKQQNKKIKIKAIERLGRLRDKRSLKSLILLLSEPNSDPKILQKILITLRKIGDLNGIEPIKNVLQTTSSHSLKKLCQKILERMLHAKPNSFWLQLEKKWDSYCLSLENKYLNPKKKKK